MSQEPVSNTVYNNLLDISRQLAFMKLGSTEKYQPIQYCWVHISRLLGYLVSYVPFAYRYPTNLLQHPDRTAFALAALMLPCLGAATYICMFMYQNLNSYDKQKELNVGLVKLC